MKYKLVIFDLDGTTLDTLLDLKESLNFALRKFAFSERSIEEVRSFVGNGIGKLIERSVPSGAGHEQVAQVKETFMEHYKGHCMDNTAPYPGILNLLCRLKEEGLLLATVSNKADSAVKILCDRFFNKTFHMALGEREGVRKKPAPDSVNEVLRALNVSPSEAVYVGDSEVDVETARNAHVDCISVTWGFRSRKCLEEAGSARATNQVIIESPEKLLEEILAGDN